MIHELLSNTVSLLGEVLEDENRGRRFVGSRKTNFIILAVNA
jgi:hypothetical protein